MYATIWPHLYGFLVGWHTGQDMRETQDVWLSFGEQQWKQGGQCRARGEEKVIAAVPCACLETQQLGRCTYWVLYQLGRDTCVCYHQWQKPTLLLSKPLALRQFVHCPIFSNIPFIWALETYVACMCVCVGGCRLEIKNVLMCMKEGEHVWPSACVYKKICVSVNTPELKLMFVSVYHSLLGVGHISLCESWRKNHLPQKTRSSESWRLPGSMHLC